MTKRYLAILAILLTLLPYRTASAQGTTGDARDESKAADEATTTIHVTATPLATDPQEIPYSILEVPGLGAGQSPTARSISEALGPLPQVMMQKTSQGQGSPFIRGFTGFRNLLLIDGIRVNSSVFRDGPNQYTTLFEPLMMERTELVLGPASVLYGSDAVGGTLQFLTRTPELTAGDRRFGGRFYQRWASAEQSFITRTEADFATDEIAFTIGGTWRDYGDLRGGEHATSAFENTSYDEWNGDAKLLAVLTDSVDLTVAYQQHRQLDVPRTHSTIFAESYRGTSIGSDLRRDLNQSRELSYARIDWEPNATARAQVTIARSTLGEVEQRVRSNGRYRKQGFGLEAHSIQVNYENGDARHAWSFGVEYVHERVGSFFREFNPDGSLRSVHERGPIADESSYQTAGLYVENRRRLGSSFELIGGARFTWVGVDADQVDPDLTDADVIASVDENFSAVVGDFRVRYEASDRLSTYVGVSQAFRAPNLSDLTRLDVARSGEAEVPATDLDPEHFVTLEGGAKWRSERVHATLGYYYTFIRDLIVRFPTGGVDADGNTIVTKDNVGDGFVHGVEVMVDVDVREDVTLFGGAAWLEGSVETYKTIGVKDEEPLSRLQPASGIIGARYEPIDTGLTFEANCQFADQASRLSPRDEADTQRIPPGGTPGFLVYGVKASWDARPGLRLFGAVENLANHDYRVHGSGTNEAGRNFIVGVDWRF